MAVEASLPVASTLPDHDRPAKSSHRSQSTQKVSDTIHTQHARLQEGFPGFHAAAGRGDSSCCKLLQGCHVQCWYVCTDTSQAADHRVMQREAGASVHRCGPADQQGLEISWLEGAQPDESSPLWVCGFPGEATVHTCTAMTALLTRAALCVTQCQANIQLHDRWQQEALKAAPLARQAPTNDAADCH